jgi:hypothetical protein
LTLYLAVTCLITSPSVAGLPSLPALLRSMDDKVNESVKTGALLTLGLIRLADPHTEVALVVGAAETSEGKAVSSVVSEVRTCRNLDCVE